MESPAVKKGVIRLPVNSNLAGGAPDSCENGSLRSRKSCAMMQKVRSLRKQENRRKKEERQGRKA
jgi:hypothetical protein